MLQDAEPVGFIPVTDGTRARAFYEGILGLPFQSEDPNAVVLAAKGMMLRLVKLDEVEPRLFTHFGWWVRDIVQTMSDLADGGVAFETYGWVDQDENGVWTSPDGTRVAWFKDPDGNLLSVSQKAE